MKRLFDTSVLVAVFYADHPQHALSSSAFRLANKEDFCAQRTLGEVYATLTALPLRPRITAREGLKIVDQIVARLSVVGLSQEEYLAALKSAVAEGIVGATAYDALIGSCALKAKADVLLTWNVRDFIRLGSSIAPLVKTPAEI